MEPLACSIGVMAYNEERNIGNLLRALCGQQLGNVSIGEIVVVAAPEDHILLEQGLLGKPVFAQRLDHVLGHNVLCRSR